MQSKPRDIVLAMGIADWVGRVMDACSQSGLMRSPFRSLLLLALSGFLLEDQLAHAQKLELPAQFDYADNFSEGLALVRIGERSVYIDKSGKQVLPSFLTTPRHLFD